MVNRTLAILCAFASLALAAPACAPGVQATRSEVSDAGAVMFNAYGDPKVGCYGCHNGDARGTKWGPNLRTAIAGQSDDDLKEIIREGQGGMPAFKDKLNDAQMTTIIAWLRTLKP